MIDRKTANLLLPLPDQSNQLADDVQRLISTLTLLDSIVNGKASVSALSAHIANNSNPHGTNAAQVGAIPDGAGTVTDPRIGPRTADPSQVASADVGTLQNWVDWFTNSLKAIKGTSTWRTAPGTTLAAAATHIANTNNPHGTTPSQIGAIAATAGAVTDTYIGDRLVEDTLVPTGNQAGLLTLLSWIVNRIKAMNGGANWRTDPLTTLVAAAAHIASTANPHATTPGQIGAPTNAGVGATGTWNIGISGAAPWAGLTGMPNTFIRASAVVTGTTQTAVVGTHYLMTSDSLSTLTLPATPSAGDVVGFTFTNTLYTNVLAANGKPIMGVVENMTLNRLYPSGQLRFIDNTKGWRL